MANNTATRVRAVGGRTARTLLHASPLWLQPKLRAARRQVKRRVAAHQASHGPLLSVIVPMYKVEEYLPSCLDSLIDQRYRNLEIVVVDDGSPDGSRAIADAYARRDPRIRVITRPNGGLSAARNTGVDAATGEYLTFADSDDIVLPDAYSAAMRSLRATGSDFAVFSYQRMNSSRRWSPPRWISDAHAEKHLHTDIEQFPDAQVNAIVCSKVFKRSFWDAQNLRFPEGVVYEDQPVTTRAYATATAFDFLPGQYYLWRQREDQTSISQQVRTVPDLQARFDAALNSLAVLTELGRTRAHDARLGQLLANDFPQSLALVSTTDDEFWSCLCDGIAALTAQAGPQVWPRVSPQHRVLYDLVTRKLRDQTLHFLELGGGNLKNFPTEVVDGHVRTLLPYHDDPEIVPDRSRLELRPHQLAVQTAVRRLVWTDQNTLQVHGWAYIDNIDLATNPTSITLVATNAADGRQIRIPTTPSPDPAVSRISKHKYCNYENSTFLASIDVSDGDWRGFDGGENDSETWSVDVHVHTAGVEGEAPLRGLNKWGSAGVPGSSERADGLRTACLVSGSGQLLLRRQYPLVRLVDASVDEHTVTMRLRTDKASTLRSVLIRDRARKLQLSSKVTAAPDGGQVVSFRLPAAGPGSWGWYVRAVTSDRREHAIAWDLGPAEYLSTDRPERFSGVWLARTPAGNVTVAQQQQRFRLLDARVSEDADTLIVDAEFDGEGELTATLLSSTSVTPVGTLDRTGRTVQLQFPLTASQWDGPMLPVPAGRYELQLLRATGPGSVRLREDIADELLASLPIRIEHERLRGRIERTPNAGHLSLTVMPPLAPDERGSRAQRQLQDWHASLVPTPRTKAVLFRTSYGENATCNAAAVHRELRRRGADLDLYWAVTDYSVAVPDGGIPVVHGSRQWYDLLRNAHYVMDNMHQPIYHAKPDHQVVVETFHGYPFKVMGHPHWQKLGLGQARIDSFDRRAREWDYLVSPARYATPLLRRDFRYDGEVLEIGYPRNDILLSAEAPSRRALVRQRLGLDRDQLVVLYAPTFRDYLSSDDHHAKMVDFLDLDRVAQVFGEDAVLLLRGHAFNARAGGLHRPAGSIIDVTLYPEVSDLYLAADAAIVDYSSLRFDFGLTGKPMIFHVPDLARYRDESRGWLFDFEPTAPGPLVDTTEEVLDALSRLDEIRGTYRQAYEAFRRDYLDLDDGHASARFVDAVFVPRGDAPAEPDGAA